MFGKLPLTSYSEYKTLIFVGSESIKRKVFGKQLYIYIYFKTGWFLDLNLQHMV